MRTLLKARPLRRTVADVIALMVPSTEAGACIPENGQQCACKRYFIGCDPYYCYYSYYKWTYNCYGTCRETRISC